MSLAGGRLVVVRGAGDLATGSIVRLVRSGFRVVALELPRPSAIRRAVSFSEAVYDGNAEVEGIRAIRHDEPPVAWDAATVPILVDPEARFVPRLAPLAVVDAILAKRNLGTRIDLAPVVVALGPGFEAGRDAHAVVETNRGHGLGRVFLTGHAEADTAVPGQIARHDNAPLPRAPPPGEVVALRAIGDLVADGEPVLTIGGAVARASIDGVLRGLIRPGYPASAGLKVADVDPRGVREHCFTVSDKARAVAGGVLEALLALAPG
ncbi:MAG TPA: selenium-dependent molybdenum cofactor biosynthesis protein YqeB [Thermoanaerobaculia bacterium]|nr:selenium-dependent molybdenum cofactor biosynthesis protein YqeB [Thermoanaerobaculia bacterium]